MSFLGDLKGPWEGLKNPGEGSSSNLLGIICPQLQQPCLTSSMVSENVFFDYTNELSAIQNLIAQHFMEHHATFLMEKLVILNTYYS